MDLLRTITIEEARRLLEENFGSYEVGTEMLPVFSAAGRYLADDIFSDELVPPFRRSIRDGYAVMADDISGASETSPSFLKVTGDVEMGKPSDISLASGEAVYVPTGGMIPEGADCVVMIEYTEKGSDSEISVFCSGKSGDYILEAGDDIRPGQKVLMRGLRIKPADIGVLTAIGCLEVRVFRKPRVAIFSTGDEIISPEKRSVPGKVRDINTYSVAAAAVQMGMEVEVTAVIPDDEEKLGRELKRALDKDDIIFLSGGSSVGKKDYSLKVINELSSGGVIFHGLAFKPGKPTIAAKAGGKPVIGLPGHPVSALVVFGLIGKYILQLFFHSGREPEFYVNAVLSENIKGPSDREHWVMVRLEGDGKNYRAVPIHGESGMITMLAGASGVVRIPLNAGIIAAGTEVRVYQLL